MRSSRQSKELCAEKLRAAGRRNSAIFARVWRQGVVPGPHQYDMARRADDEGVQYEGDFWPRDHGKSEIFCIAYPLRRICEDPNVRILIVQKTATEAEKTLEVIKRELERNGELKRYYAPHWEATVGQRDISNATGVVERAGRREGTWQKRRIYVKRARRGKDPTIEAVGVGGAITGGHFDVIVLDDVEDDENTKTGERLKSLLRWFTGTILQLREPHTKVMVVGTLKTAGADIYNFMLGNPMWDCKVVGALLSHTLEEVEYEAVRAPDGRVVDVKVVTPGVVTLWPARWPIQALLLEMLASVRSIWIREKLNDLRAMAGKIFRREWFGYFEELPVFEELVQAWDTAFEEGESADWSACVTVGMAGGAAFVVDVLRARLEMPELVEAMEAQYRRWRPRAVVVEDRASGKSAIQVLKRETGVPVVAIGPGGRDKVARARAVTPYYESGRVLHRAGAGWLDVFEDELTMFPEGEHDDQVDAVVYGLLRLFVGEGTEERTETVAARVVGREGLFG